MPFRKNNGSRYTEQRRKHIPTIFGKNPLREGIKKAIFLDRDDVIVKDTGYISSPEELILFPDVTPVLIEMQDSFRLIVVTNQSGVARGYFSEDVLFTINQRLIRMLDDDGVGLDAIYYCPHHPEVGKDEYRMACECRKPQPGLIRLAADEFGIDLAQSFLVGDQETDIQAGRAMGVKTIKINREERDPADQDQSAADYKIKTFAEIRNIIMR